MDALQVNTDEVLEIDASIKEADNTRDINIISTVLHQIDVENKESQLIPITSINSDLKIYLRDLLAEITIKTQKREYTLKRTTTEFYASLDKYFHDQQLSTNKASSDLASRLLDKEIATDKKYGHLGNQNSHVKKGSFLQFLYKDYNSNTCYLGVKIEHQTFLDEVDFKKRIGLSIANKIYKAVKVSFNSTGTPKTVTVYDNNKKPANYWWNEFLELQESRTNSKNTNDAVTSVIQVLNRYKEEHPLQHTILRNAVVTAFKQNSVMKYDEFIENTFENYDTTDDEKFSLKLPNIIKTLKELPEKKGFDTQFKLVPSEVPYKKSKVKLSDEIAIEYEDGIKDLNDKIWSEETSSGEKLVVISSPEGFKKFIQKERA